MIAAFYFLCFIQRIPISYITKYLLICTLQVLEVREELPELIEINRSYTRGRKRSGKAEQPSHWVPCPPQPRWKGSFKRSVSLKTLAKLEVPVSPLFPWDLYYQREVITDEACRIVMWGTVPFGSVQARCPWRHKPALCLLSPSASNSLIKLLIKCEGRNMILSESKNASRA